MRRTTHPSPGRRLLAARAWARAWALASALAVALPCGLAACDPARAPRLDAGSDAGPSDAGDATPLGPRFPACDPGASLQTVTFVHVNDLHSTFHPDGASSPAARIRGFYDQVRTENPYTFFTDAGDDHEKGWLAEQRSGGWATLEVVRALGFDVRTLGNHDFAWGPEELLAHSRDPHAVVLATNMQWLGPDPSAFGAVGWATFEVGCLRVGFFGMVSMPWDEQNEQYDGPFLAGYDDPRFDYVNVARAVVERHREEVDLLVMVSHLGLGMDEHVAAWVTGIDVILSGHSHDAVATPVNANGALIVQTGAYARNVGRLDVDIDLHDGRRVARRYALVENAPGALPADPAVERLVRELLARWSPDWDTPVAQVGTALDTPGVAALAARAAWQVHGADAGLVDEWEVWRAWPAGPLTPQELLDTFKVERAPSGTPGFNSFYRVAMDGADLARLATRLDPGRWGLDLAADPVPGVSYTLVLQKHVAFHPGAYLPAGVTLGPPVPLEETWATVHRYAVERAAACQHLEADTPLPACP